MSCELIIHVYEHDHFNGQYRTIISDEPNFEKIGFNDTVSSIRIDKGPSYRGDDVVYFYRDDSYRGDSIGPYGPGQEVANLKDVSFNDCISSARLTQK